MALEETVGKHHGKGIGGALVKGAVITAAAGVLGSAALLAYANVSNTSIPELWQNITSRLHQEEYVLPRPTQQPNQLTTYQSQALEQIAAIRQKEPGLAQLLPQTGWFSNGVDQTEAEFVGKIGKYVADGNYVLDKITHNDGSVTNLLVLSVDGAKRTESLAKTQQYLPAISRLLRIEYKKSLLIVDIFEGGGGASFRNVSIADQTDLPHELTHMVYDFGGDENSPLAQVPVWFTEGLADLVARVIRGGDEYVERQYKVYRESIEKGLLKVEPLSLLELLPGVEGSRYSLGFMLLVDYKILVGDENFLDALHHVHQVRIAKGVIPHKVLINKDLENPSEKVKAIIKGQHEELEAILEQHVPPDRLPEFRQLYQSRVYGVQTQP